MKSHSSRLKFLLDTLDLTQQQFATSIGVSQSAVSQIAKGKTSLSFETIEKISSTYHVDCNWLVHGIGEPFIQGMQPEMVKDRILSVTVDTDGEPSIVLVPVKAQAGYALGRTEGAYLKSLPSFTIPHPSLRYGTFRAFEVDGDSMEPSLFKGDYIICSYVENWEWLRDMYLYVVVVQGDVLVKRVKNHIRTNKTLEIISDNRYYPPFLLSQNDIVEVWAVKARVTYNFPAPLLPSNDHIHDVTRNLAIELQRAIQDRNP